MNTVVKGIIFLVVVISLFLLGSLYQKINLLEHNKGKTDTIETQDIKFESTPTTIVKEIEILKIDNKATEKNDVWWRYSWLVTLKNTTIRTVPIEINLKWVDENKLVLDDNVERVRLEAGETKTFNDFELIDVQTAPNVKDLQVELKMVAYIKGVVDRAISTREKFSGFFS